MRVFHFHALEQGTGKTWVAINTAAALYLNGKIDALVVLAPNGVHTAWAREQLPAHMPAVVPMVVHEWHSGPERQQRQRARRLVHAELRTLLAAGDNFVVLVMNSEAFGTVRAAQATVETVLRNRRTLLVADESSTFSTPSAKRTRALLRLGPLAAYRRCLDGTPSDGTPFDLYAQYNFLHPGILRCATFAAFKKRYAEWVEHERSDTGRKFSVVRTRHDGSKVFKHLDELREKIAPYTSRITKAEALPHLPPKLFSKRYFPLTDEQQRLTEELRDDLQTQLASGATVTATNVLTNYLRRQQVSCGYVPTDVVWSEGDDPDDALSLNCQPIEQLTGGNPRLTLALEELQRLAPTPDRPVIVWTRFHLDIDLLRTAFAAQGWSVGVYDGRVPKGSRAQTLLDFQAGATAILLANPAAGGVGLNLQRAHDVLYYANYFGLRRRLQSEDRCHRIGTHNAVRYVDLVATSQRLTRSTKELTIDERILRAFRQHMDIADLLNQDARRLDWI